MKLPESVKGLLRNLAPTVVAALTGPFAPLAAGLVTVALKRWLPEGTEQATPEQIVRAVDTNLGNAALVTDLRNAEKALQEAEKDLGFKFAELEQKDRSDARAFGRDTGLARAQFYVGMGLVGIALLMLFGVIAGCILALTGNLGIDPAQSQIAIAAFGLIGTIVGIMQGLGAQIIGYFYGSSSSSRDKTDQISDTMQDLGAALSDRVRSQPHPAPAPLPAPIVVAPPIPAPPLPKPSADWMQGPFGGVRWRMTPRGVLLEGSQTALRTIGVPATTRRIWKDFGPLIAHSCINNEVPMEIVVACIATESRGKPKAFLVEPDKRVSVGLMQTLTGTASEVMGREVSAQDLNDPALSIEAGTRYIARQRPKTGCQPPLVAAAYNAGGLYRARPGDDNPFNLRSTGGHILRFCEFFGDACVVAAEDKWQQITTDVAA